MLLQQGQTLFVLELGTKDVHHLLNLLRKNGYNVKIERISSGKSAGCGYSIILTGDIEGAEELLRQSGIKFLEINEK